MTSVRGLTQLSALVSSELAPDEALQRALPLLRDGLAAQDVFVIYAEGAAFASFGTVSGQPLTDVALWLVHRDLASRGDSCAFDLRDGHVVDFRNVRARRACQHVAAAVPMPDRTAEMLVARGSWPRGLGARRFRFLRAALPAVALLLDRRIDSSRAERKRHQLSALANIARAMSESEDLEAVLTSIAGTITTVTGIDYVSIDIVDAEGNVRLRSVNSIRPEVGQVRDRWVRGASRPDPVRDTVIRTGRPMVFRDCQNDGRIPESGRNFFVRALIMSSATFPLQAKDEMLGTLSVASHRPLEFTPTELDLLEGLAAQVATAVKGIALYQELAESRRELQRLNAQLHENVEVQHHLARTDPLTGIPNRRFIDEAVDAECARASRYGHPLSVVILDVDNLKQINDSAGHDAGDRALKVVARLAQESVRRSDLVGRYGGDEFVFVLPSTRLEEATSFAERFRHHIEETLIPAGAGNPIRLTASLGVARWGRDVMDAPIWLIRQADRAMYAAKEAGRNRTMVLDGDTARAA